MKVEISRFEDHPVTKDWAAQTKQLIELLTKETEVTSEKAVEVLVSLTQQSQTIDQLVSQIYQMESAHQYSVAGNGVARQQRCKQRH